MPTTAVAAQPVRLLLTRGNRLRFSVVVKRDGDAVDLTGYVPALHFRRYVDSDATLLALATADPSATGLSVASADGRVTVHISPTTSAGLTFRHAVYDLTLTSASDRLTPIRGELLISQAVTR
jgi:hypothetical protein